MSKISKNHRKLIALFSMSEGFAVMLRGYYRDRPQKPMVQGIPDFEPA